MQITRAPHRRGRRPHHLRYRGRLGGTVAHPLGQARAARHRVSQALHHPPGRVDPYRAWYQGRRALRLGGIAGPAGLPAEVTAWWAKHIATALGQPEVVERMKGMGLEPDPLTGEPFIRFVRDQYDTWGKRIREAGIRG